MIKAHMRRFRRAPSNVVWKCGVNRLVRRCSSNRVHRLVSHVIPEAEATVARNPDNYPRIPCMSDTYHHVMMQNFLGDWTSDLAQGGSGERGGKIHRIQRCTDLGARRAISSP